MSPNLIATKQKKVTQKSEKQLSLKNYQQEKLSTKNSYQTISNVFAIGKSTIPTIYENRSLFFWPTFFLGTFLMLKLPFSQVALSILPENSAQEQASLALSICTHIFIAILRLLELRYMKKLFWNNKRTVFSRLVILSYFASCIFKTTRLFTLFFDVWTLLMVIIKTTDKSQTITDESQTSHRWLQTSQRWVIDNYRWVIDHYRRVTDSYKQIPDKFRWAPDYYSQQEPQRCIFQPLTWFNKFVCRPSDIYYYAIWFIYETY